MARSYSYAKKQSLTSNEIGAARDRGIRFRSRPGAPQATPPSGLSGGMSTPTPEATAGRDADWGRLFGRNSVFGGRGGPQPSQQRPQGGSTSFGIKQQPSIFNPSEEPAVPFTLRGETDGAPLIPESSGGFSFGASAMPGMSFDATPDEMKRATVSELEKWHADNRVPLPEQAGMAKESTVDDYQTGRRTSSYSTPYGKASISQRLSRLNT